MNTEARLSAAHAEIASVLGPLGLVIAAKRGLSRSTMRQWAETLHNVATALEEIAK